MHQLMPAWMQRGRVRPFAAGMTVLALALAGAALSGCSSAAMSTSEAQAQRRPTELNVSAASSLKRAFEELAPEFEKANGVEVVFNFGASGQLQKQIEAGAPVDVFASASPRQVDALIARGMVSAAETSTFAGNDLVIIVPAGVTGDIAGPRDLVALDRVTTGNPQTTPHGAAAREWLTSVGVWGALRDKLVFAENAAQTLDYVSRGEAQAAIGFASEAFGNPAVEVAYTVPAESITPIAYVVAPVSASEQTRLAQAFAEYLGTPEAQAVLKENGFKEARR